MVTFVPMKLSAKNVRILKIKKGGEGVLPAYFSGSQFGSGAPASSLIQEPLCLRRRLFMQKHGESVNSARVPPAPAKHL
jgi:hypothetical protein